ncbi:9433_t:CDS:2 [Funneliformis geosporum]|uniref:18581_t:CDS:1 n=1 Tax=Funneliformis geosporum TaxID=1117311 RepID=A0A9W4WWV1_9GLOM|nr:9433_t:CDS:2 [Funneliformis geosporum]CAI2185026.1 18581_t:CDS:2 [Funneliformis geosporum]
MRMKLESAKTNESDLMLAIKITSSGNHKVIVAMLLEYYSNNAEKDTGWMFTVTKALPSLNNRNFESNVKELFYNLALDPKKNM